jgi:Gas vesicle protein G
MLVVDDALCFPLKSLLMIFREIYNAALQEQEQEGDQIRLELSKLYHSLETGAIDEATFDERERDLLDRLDALEAKQGEMESDGENSSGELEPEMDEQDLDGYDDDEDVGPYEYLPSSDQEP